MIKVDAARLRAYLESDTDSEALTADEFVTDLYDAEKPLTLTIAFEKGKPVLVAAAYLAYSEELDGWYMTERTENEDEINAALERALSAEK